MRRFFTLVLLGVVVPALPAVAQTEDPERTPTVALPVLTGWARDEVALLDGGGGPPGLALLHDDLADLVVGREVRIDHLVGSLRAEADRTLRESLSRPAVTILTNLPPGISLLEATALVGEADLAPGDRAHAERLMAQWIDFAEAIATLRDLGTERGPDRVCPVLGTVWFTDDWGDGRPGARTHRGNDLMAPRGTPVQAIEDGVVVQANWHWQGGRQIWVRADATGDVYYYAHLDYWEKWIWTGTRVRRGDVMGLLGSSGNADGPHLHFGWMPGTRRVALEALTNPYPLLNEICTDRTDPPSWFTDW